MAQNLLDKAAARWRQRAARATQSYSDGWTEGVAQAHGLSPDEVQPAVNISRQGENYGKGVDREESATNWKAGYRNAYRCQRKD